MPLPTPNDGETKEKFIDRCMSAEGTKSEFPDTNQRLAVCNRQWDDKDRAVAPRIERRVVTMADLRVDDHDKAPSTITGYAARFNSPSLDLGGFTEMLSPGAFGPALSAPHDVRALINHDASLVLGRTRAGTLRLMEDTQGLWMECVLPDTQAAHDLAVSIKRHDVDQMSFAFMLPWPMDSAYETWTWDDGGKGTRTIHRVSDLFDVSVVTYPAYPDTSVAVRHFAAAQAKRPLIQKAPATDALRVRLQAAIKRAAAIDERLRLVKAKSQ